MAHLPKITVIMIAAAAVLGADAVSAQDPADLLPAVAISAPAVLVQQVEPAAVPSTVTIAFDGSDPDGSSGLPIRFRYLLTPALLVDDTYADTRLAVEQYVMDLAAYSLADWSDWLPWDPDPENRQLTFVDLPAVDLEGRQIYYLFVLQAMDELSAASVDRAYGVNLAHFFIDDTAPR